MHTPHSRLPSILIGLHAVLVALLCACAAYLYVVPCEGFECLGVAIAWMAWVVVYALTMGLGFVALHYAKKVTSGRPLPKALLWLQAVLGLVLFCIWLHFRFA